MYAWKVILRGLAPETFCSEVPGNKVHSTHYVSLAENARARGDPKPQTITKPKRHSALTAQYGIQILMQPIPTSYKVPPLFLYVINSAVAVEA
jgi:hypothetical protein